MTIPRQCKNLENYIKSLTELLDGEYFFDVVYSEIKNNPRQRIEYKSEFLSFMRGLYCRYKCEKNYECDYNLEMLKVSERGF